MAQNINEIRAALQFGGARPSQFDVTIVPTNPALTLGLENLRFFCRAASLPSSTVGVVDVPYFGRKIKVAGDRVFEDWTVTVINDEDFLIRNAMERWVSFINSPEGNLASSNVPLEYKGIGLVRQHSKAGGVIRTYNINGLFPTVVSAIDVDWDATDQIEEFQVTFALDYSYPESGNTPNLPIL